jgi:hypothetical protein
LVCLAFVGLTSALPLNVEQKSDNGARVFLVRVDEAQPPKADLPKPTGQPKRDFPWPYPPVFENYLPDEVKQRLTVIYMDQSLSTEVSFFRR